METFFTSKDAIDEKEIDDNNDYLHTLALITEADRVK